MRLEQLVHSVEARLFGLLAEDETPSGEEMDTLRARISRQEEELNKLTARRLEVTTRLENTTQIVALLPSQIESSFRRGKTSQAMRQALELERLRRELDKDRAELPRIEQAIWSLGFGLRLLRRQWSHLSAGKRQR
jgi:predicted RNase H-like nuclease (RuvC/YqgF family)